MLQIFHNRHFDNMIHLDKNKFTCKICVLLALGVLSTNTFAAWFWNSSEIGRVPEQNYTFYTSDEYEELLRQEKDIDGTWLFVVGDGCSQDLEVDSDLFDEEPEALWYPGGQGSPSLDDLDCDWNHF